METKELTNIIHVQSLFCENKMNLHSVLQNRKKYTPEPHLYIIKYNML